MTKKILFTGLDPSIFLELGAVTHFPVMVEEPYLPGQNALINIHGQLAEGQYQGIVLTTKQAVQHFIEPRKNYLNDLIQQGNVWLLAIGNQTSIALNKIGVPHEALLEGGDATHIAAHLKHKSHNQNILLVPGTHAPAHCKEMIEKNGARVTLLQLHQLKDHPNLGDTLPPHDVLYLVSPNAARKLWNTYGKEAFKKEIWVLGPAISKTLKTYGIESKVMQPSMLKQKQEAGVNNELV